MRAERNYVHIVVNFLTDGVPLPPQSSSSGTNDGFKDGSTIAARKPNELGVHPMERYGGYGASKRIKDVKEDCEGKVGICDGGGGAA